MDEFVFETAMNRIEEISRLLQDEKVPFDELIKLYEEGTLLAKKCDEYLTEAEFKLKIKEEDNDAV